MTPYRMTRSKLQKMAQNSKKWLKTPNFKITEHESHTISGLQVLRSHETGTKFFKMYENLHHSQCPNEKVRQTEKNEHAHFAARKIEKFIFWN